MYQWKCPRCWGENLDYGTVEFYDDQCYFPRECKNCKAEWEEWYSMEFIGHENVNTENCLDTNQKEDGRHRTTL